MMINVSLLGIYYSFIYRSHDNAIYIFSTGKKWKPMGKGPLNKHSSYITHFDFSEVYLFKLLL